MLPSPATPAKHDPYAALRSGGFFAYAFGWVAAVLGQQMASVALGWDIYHRTGSAMSLGWVGLVQAIPVIALALPAGMLADRFDRRKIVILTQLLIAVTSFALAIVSARHGTAGLIDAVIRGAAYVGLKPTFMQVELGLMYAIICSSAIAAAIGGPARSAILPQIVPTAIFSNAVAWNSSFFQMASVIGPALGGLLLVYTIPGVYVLDGFLAIVFALAMFSLKVRPAERSREPASLRTLTEGIRFVWKNQIILATITLDLFAVLLGGAVFLLPIFADRLGEFHLGSIVLSKSVVFGWLRAAPAIGAVMMGLLITHMPPMKHAGRAMLLSVAGFGAATIVFGLSRSFPLSFAMLLLTGAFDNVSVVVRHTLVQVLAPDSMRGRVSAVNNVFIGASNELGGFESGLTARLFGAVISVVAGGIGTIAVVAAAAITWPKLRNFGSLHDAKPIDHETERGFEVVIKPAEPGPNVDA